MDLKVQALPLARIKKIMKLDEDVKMISAEAPMLFAKAAEIFIHELTLRAWIHTEDNKRRTLQVCLQPANVYICPNQIYFNNFNIIFRKMTLQWPSPNMINLIF